MDVFLKQILHKSGINGLLRASRWREAAVGTKSRMDEPITPRYAMSGFHIEMGGFLYAVARDVAHRTSQRRHDMAAKTISNRTNPKNPKGLCEVRFISVRDRRSKEQSLTEPIRRIRKVCAKFGSFRLETEKTKGMIRLLEPRLRWHR